MQKRILMILTAMLLLLTLASCKKTPAPDDQSQEPSPTEAPTPTAAPTPEPDQAPEIGDSGIPGLSVEELSAFWRRTDGSTATIPLTAALNDAFGGGGSPPVHNTTSNAYRSLIYKENTDLIIVTRPSEEEFDLAKNQGVTLEVIPLVKDALVFLVNIENQVDNISLEQLRDVYAGKITKWNALGGRSANIIPYQRTQNSGSQTLLLRLVMDGRAPMEPPTEWIAETMGALVEIVSTYDNARDAIGYSMFYYVNNMYGNENFKLLGIDGVKPSRDAIMRGEYPLEDYYYAVIRGDTPEDHPARKIIDWLLTDEGQALAARAGYIPLRPMENVWPDASIDPIYLGETNSSSGTGGTVLKPELDDIQPVNGVRPPLSDVFFDGFNYISYINMEIMAQLDQVDNEFIFSGTWAEQYQKRPFPGIPSGYPNYQVNYHGTLLISFPENNPFFDRAMYFHITLTKDISPYGVGLPEISVAYEHAGRFVPRVDLFTASVSLLDKPAVSARINEQLKAWVGSFPKKGAEVDTLTQFIEWYTGSVGSDWVTAEWVYKLQPSVETWRDYLSVSYVLQLYDGPAIGMPMFRTISFDMRTGNVVDLAKIVSGELDYAFSRGYTRADFSDLNDWGWFGQEGVPDGYVPAAGSVITDAWIMYGDINIYVTTPNGLKLQFNFWEPFID